MCYGSMVEWEVRWMSLRDGDVCRNGTFPCSDNECSHARRYNSVDWCVHQYHQAYNRSYTFEQAIMSLSERIKYVDEIICHAEMEVLEL